MSIKPIYIYTGPGSDQFCTGHTIKSLNTYLGNRSAQVIPIDDPAYLTSREWFRDVQAFVVPGGSAMAMAASFKPEGLNIIKNYIEQGGNYLGFCAGAYLVSDSKFLVNINTSFTLDSIPLTGRTLYGPQFSKFDSNGRQVSISLATAKLVPVSAGRSPFHVFWNGGGAFGGDGNDIPHAFYKEGSPKIAALTNYVGTGSVTTSNIHPEIRMDDQELNQWLPEAFNKEEYLASLPKQEQLFSELCRYANL